MGRPRKSVSRKKLRLLASRMNSIEDMARILDVSPDTLTRNYNDEIERGRAEARHSLRVTQFTTALKGSPALLIWLGKVLLGQRETLAEEATAVVTPEKPIASMSLEQMAVEMLELINVVRKRNGAEPWDIRDVLGYGSARAQP